MLAIRVADFGLDLRRLCIPALLIMQSGDVTRQLMLVISPSAKFGQ